MVNICALNQYLHRGGGGARGGDDGCLSSMMSHRIVDRFEGSVIGLLPLRDANVDLLVTSYQQRLPTKPHQKTKTNIWGTEGVCQTQLTRWCSQV